MTSDSDIPYRHACVRDLAWAIGSPPLMLPQQATCQWYDMDWYRQLYQDSHTWLRTVDAEPDALLSLINSNPDRRLGSYFETLWAFYFMHAPRFSLLARNLQIIQHGRTLGELDFVVRDHVAQKNLHIEMAIKFYLGLDDTHKQQNWHGPGKKDRLDIKMNSLLQRQSVFASQPAVAATLAAMDMEVDDCAVILKGRLFYPGERSGASAPPPRDSHPLHLRSRWLRYQAFECEPGKRYLPLLRSGWLTSPDSRDDGGFASRETLQVMLEKGELRLPLLLLVFADGEEVERIFVMPDDWAASPR